MSGVIGIQEKSQGDILRNIRCHGRSEDGIQQRWNIRFGRGSGKCLTQLGNPPGSGHVVMEVPGFWADQQDPFIAGYLGYDLRKQIFRSVTVEKRGFKGYTLLRIMQLLQRLADRFLMGQGGRGQDEKSTVFYINHRKDTFCSAGKQNPHDIL